MYKCRGRNRAGVALLPGGKIGYKPSVPGGFDLDDGRRRGRQSEKENRDGSSIPVGAGPLVFVGVWVRALGACVPALSCLPAGAPAHLHFNLLLVGAGYLGTWVHASSYIHGHPSSPLSVPYHAGGRRVELCYCVARTVHTVPGPGCLR